MPLLETLFALCTLKNILTFLLVFVTFKIISLWIQWQREEKDFHNIPRVPATVPLLGHLFSILTSGAVWDLFADWILQYGNTLRFPMWNETVILTADVGFVKHMMVHDYMKYHKVDHERQRPPISLLLIDILSTAFADLRAVPDDLRERPRDLSRGTVEEPKANHWSGLCGGHAGHRHEPRLRSRYALCPQCVCEEREVCSYSFLDSVERLSKRMDDFRKENKLMELDEEFRRMAIGVIGQVGKVCTFWL